MDIIKALLKELEQEFNTTRKFLAIVPADKLDWAPHEKSMKMKPLAAHIADLPSWVSLALTKDGLDFATMDWTPPTIENAGDLIKILEKSYTEGRAELEKATLAQFDEPWVLRSGETIHATYTKYETICHSLSQTAHHRAQLGVYLRILDIPIPGSYGPSADDMNF